MLCIYTLKFDGSSNGITFHIHISIAYHPYWLLSYIHASVTMNSDLYFCNLTARLLQHLLHGVTLDILETTAGPECGIPTAVRVWPLGMYAAHFKTAMLVDNLFSSSVQGIGYDL